MNKPIIVLTILFCCIFSNSVSGDVTASPEKVIQNYIVDLNNHQWKNASYWWVEEHKNELLDFVDDKENQKYKHGLLNIEEAKLVRWKELPYEYGKQFLPSRYIEKFTNPRVYYVGVNLKVHNQNKFFIDGGNYFFIVMVLEDGEWKIALTPHVPVMSIIRDGYGFGTEDEKTYEERRLKFYKTTID
ncbi:hypothetical protein [Neobacillus vireti]|uniref:DUF4829 domain-containing protein n=1 Tax=Neobacillus vireti LMG 21834 TaxID=1131730 RepID=A0AB94IMM9_9BACI|nr:hypothetical protein [Neobacillus vireti]ETI68262.1 hypothetical protein BAVI_13409 [Neobacillus vireti LMG 21834]KLT17723.1 hypothetical protein AA980_11470 [Neobacillus vireti]